MKVTILNYVTDLVAVALIQEAGKTAAVVGVVVPPAALYWDILVIHPLATSYRFL